MCEQAGFDTLVALNEAIQRMRASEGDMTHKMSADMTQAFEQHDAVHILFNCGTSIEDEIAVHVWMIFATTIKMSQMHRAVANQEHRNVLSGVGHLKLIGIWFICLPRIIDIIYKSLRMKKKLAVEQLARLKEQSILEIRQEHGIIL